MLRKSALLIVPAAFLLITTELYIHRRDVGHVPANDIESGWINERLIMENKHRYNEERTPPDVVVIEPFDDDQNVISSTDKNNAQLPLTGKAKHDGSWLFLEDDFRSLYLYNIFWDSRASLASSPVLRVLGISTTRAASSGEEEEPYYQTCFMTCKADGPVHEVPYDPSDSVLIYLPRLVINILYERHVFLCRLAAAPCKYPHRAVVMLGPSPNITRPDHLDERNSLLVEYPAQPGEAAVVQVGLCGPLLFGVLDPHRLIEWLEMVRLLGVEEVVLYNNTMDDVITRVVAAYERQGFVELRRMEQDGIVPRLPNDVYRDDIYAIGTIALTDCMYRNMFRFRWMAVLDVDEVILPRRHADYPALLAELDSVPGSKLRVGYKFLHADFVLDPVLDPRPDPDAPPYARLARYTRRFDVQPPTYHAKSIVRPEYCTAMHYHVCRGFTPGVALAKPVKTTDAMDCHYRTKLCPADVQTYEECVAALDYGEIQTDNIILPFKHKLLKSLAAQLDVLGLKRTTRRT